MYIMYNDSMNKVKPLIKFLLFQLPCFTLSCLIYIIFDNEEIMESKVRTKKIKINKKKEIDYIKSFLNKCYDKK